MKFALARRRELWVPTWRGWLLLGIVAVLGLATVFIGAYPFLAVNQPLPHADVLLVEGWVSDHTLKAAREEWQAGRCDLICTAGVDLERGQKLAEWKDYAHLSAATLEAMGVPKARLIAVPGGSQQLHRTFRSLSEAKKVLETLEPTPRAINLLTEAHHGRRSAQVVRKVFGESTAVGVISVPPESYDPARWWASSAGAKNVLMELVATGYEWLWDSGRAEM